MTYNCRSPFEEAIRHASERRADPAFLHRLRRPRSPDHGVVLSGGAISRHEDVFDLYRWTRMALGPAGVLPGWTGLIQNKVRGQANAQLEKFVAREKKEIP